MVLPEMKARQDGVIIIVSSVGGLKGHGQLGAYCISKAADLQLVRNLAFEKILHVNIMANHWLAQLVLPEMKSRKDGVIIIVSSVGGLKGHGQLGAYCISKAADLRLVRNLAFENGPDNIRVNAISPGLIRTDFARALWENPATLQRRTANDPLRRIGEPEEIAGIAVYLAAKSGSFTTGQNFVIDGGSTIST